MLCLRCTRGLVANPISLRVSRQVQPSVFKAASKRTFTSLGVPSRPTVLPRSALFTPSSSLLNPSASATGSLSTTGEILDLLPKVSTHPGLAGIQVRCGPRDTYDPSHFVRKRRHGFLSRIRTRKGRNTIARRRAKKRSTLSH